MILPRRFNRQPQGPVEIDWSNTLTANLDYALVNGVDLVDRSPSGLVQVTPTPLGLTERGETAYKPNADTAPCTVIGHAFFTSNNADYAALEWGFYVNAGINLQLGIGLLDTNTLYAVNRSNGSGTTSLKGISFPYSSVLAITGILGSGASATAYENGIVLNTIPQSGVSSFFTDGRKRAKKFTPTSSGKASAFLYKFSRVLSAYEIKALSDNPWQIFRPRKQILYFDVTASTPTLSFATATSITSTSAVPQVTLTF